MGLLGDICGKVTGTVTQAFDGAGDMLKGAGNEVKGAFTLNPGEMGKGLEQLGGGAVKVAGAGLGIDTSSQSSNGTPDMTSTNKAIEAAMQSGYSEIAAAMRLSNSMTSMYNLPSAAPSTNAPASPSIISV